MLWLFPLMLLLSVDADTEGDSCITDGGEAGACTLIYFCSSALAAFETHATVTACDSSEPLVCCVTSDPTTAAPVVTPTTKQIQVTSIEDRAYVEPEYVNDADEPSTRVCKPLSPSRSPPKNGNKAWDKCKEYQEQLVLPCRRSVAGRGMERVNRCHHNAKANVLGGEDAEKDEFPHMALLGYSDDAGGVRWMCGGTLVSERFVLTAGHCTASREFGPVTHVSVGILRRSDVPSRPVYAVKRIIKHPQYQSPMKYNDIALLELDTSVPLSDRIVPACLHTGTEAVAGRNVTATGWGLTSNRAGDTAEVLQKVVLQSFNTSECRQHHTHNRHLDRGIEENTQICYGDKFGGKDTCQGDSGGPLQVTSALFECMYTVIGVTSFGPTQCGRAGVPAVYTRVEYYLDWIADTVWP